jgi:hypothetical protein
MTQFIDSRGVRIKVGDIIVYPIRRRGVFLLKEATVCEVPGKGCTVKEGIVCLNNRGRRVIVQRPDRCAVVSDFLHRNKKRE